MKISIASLLSTLTVAGLGLLSTASVTAQTDRTIRLALPTAKIPAVTIGKRAPITKAVPWIHPVTGRLVQPTDIFTLPSGKKATAAEIAKAAAPYEKEINALGFSIYALKDPALKITPVQDTAALKKQHDELIQDHKAVPNSPETMVNRQNLFVAQNAFIEKNLPPGQDAVVATPAIQAGLNAVVAQFPTDGLKDLVYAPPNPTGYAFDRYYNYYKSLGDSSSFLAYIYANLHLYGGRNDLGYRADGIAGGAAFGHYFVLLNSSGDGRSYQGNVSGHITLDVLGYPIINTTYNQPVAFNGDHNWPIEVAAPYHIWIGPLPVGGRVGVRGVAGLRYGGGLYGGTVSANLNPYASVSGFAEAGIDVWFAGAGVGGALTFLRDDLNLTAQLYLGGTQAKPTLTASFYAYNDINTLSGRLYVWAQLFGFRGEHDFYNWSGFSSRGYLFSGASTVPL